MTTLSEVVVVKAVVQMADDWGGVAALAPALQVQCGRSRDIEAFLADNVVRQLRLLSNELLLMLDIIIGLEWLPWSLAHQNGVDEVRLLLVEGILQPSEEWMSRCHGQPG